MLRLTKFLRANHWRAAMVGSVAVALVVAAGGWALAGLVAGHRAPGLDMSVAALRAASGAAGPVSQNGSHAAGSQAPSSQPGAPHGGAAPAANTLPPGLLAISTQASLGLSLGADAATTTDHSATGGGVASFFHLGFTAQSHRNGKVSAVSGNAEFPFQPPFRGDVHIQLNCLQIAGNDAYMSGTLMKPAFGLAAGTEMLFGVQDDDTVAKPDLISDIYFSPTGTATCQTFHPKPHYTVQGNIEIH